MYTVINFKSKKALREYLATGKRVECYQPGGIFPGSSSGSVALEGPHYPAPHSWYASAVLVDSCIVKLDGKSVDSIRSKMIEKMGVVATPAERAAVLAPTVTCSPKAAVILRSIGVDVDDEQVR